MMLTRWHRHPLAAAARLLVLAGMAGIALAETPAPTPGSAPGDASESTPSPAPAPQEATAAPDFTSAVKPILETRCVSCHGAEKQKGDLALHTAEAAEEALAPGRPAESGVLERIALPAGHDDVMPPKDGPLNPQEQAVLEMWIAAGAPWPEGVALEARDPNAEPDTKPLVAIEVYPPDVRLETARDTQGFVVMARYADDTTRDVTTAADCVIGAPELVRRDGRILTPLADGETALLFTYRDQECAVPVAVRAATTDRPISFRLDVMPVFMREGCNTGSCHGAARGKDGFMLSLFGYDPAGDHYRITRELAGRRINLALPHASMLLEKAIEAVPHSGGKLFERDSASYRTLLRWLEADTPDDPADVAEPVSLEIYPKQMVLEGVGATQQMTVRCRYSDGTDRDVTDLAVFMGNNDPAAAVDKHGLVTANGRGEAFIMARFATFTEGSQCIVIPRDLEYEKPMLAENNYVDELVHAKLHKLRILPSGTCSDERFIRRAHLDIVGVLPTREEFDAFVADADPAKREKLVDTLLARKEFTEVWVMKFAELLQIRTQDNQGMSYKATLLYFNWLQDRIANNVPFDEIVKELLATSGGTFKSPATNYYQVERDTLKLAENCAQIFMGMRLQCAQCHNHPFDRWTMNDYYGFASFFTQVGRKNAEDPRETIIFNSGGGEVNHPVTKKPVAPTFLGGGAPDLAGRDRRAALAEWLASPDNPYFATNLANIVWAHFFGIGIIDPVDDVRISNPASNPQLLAELGRRFTEYDYDFRRLVRDICTSQTYQRSTEANASNEGDTVNFARALVRRQRAEVLLDNISQVTETPNKFQGLPLGARAVQIADGNVSNFFLTTFGRATRETVCSCEVVMEPNLGQALHLINGDTTGNRIRQGNVVGKLLEAGTYPADVLEELYVRCVSRLPTEKEKGALLAQIEAETDDNHRREVLEDVFWALLNSKEFLFNH